MPYSKTPPMKTHRSLLLPAVAAVLSLAVPAGTAQAQVVLGTDNASAEAYLSGWTNGSDGFITGPGAYGQWFLGGNASAFNIATAAGVGNPSAAVIDISGISFRLYEAGNYADAFRFIDPDGLGAGLTFSLQLAVNFRAGFKGFDLRDMDDSVVFNFNIGGDDYVVSNAASGNGSIGDDYSSFTIFTLSFTQIDASGGTWSLERSGDITSFTTGTYDGVARSFKLYNSGASGDENALFFNNLGTVPEPSTWALLLLGGTAAWAWRRRMTARR